MTKHTPGPWSYHRTHRLSKDTWYVICDANGYGPIIEIGGRDLNGQIAEAKHLITDDNEIEANAKLIAQSPRMVDVLKCALADLWGYAMDFDLDLEGDEPTCQTIREIKSVLADAGIDTSDYEIGNA